MKIATVVSQSSLGHLWVLFVRDITTNLWMGEGEHSIMDSLPHTLQCLEPFLVPLQLSLFLLNFCFQVCLIWCNVFYSILSFLNLCLHTKKIYTVGNKSEQTKKRRNLQTNKLQALSKYLAVKRNTFFAIPNIMIWLFSYYFGDIKISDDDSDSCLS